MPNWCSNRMYFSGEPAQIAEIKRLASGAVTPLYRRATNEGIQLFLAGSAGLLQITENIRSEQCPGVTAAGRGAVSLENIAFTRWLTHLQNGVLLDEQNCLMLHELWLQSGTGQRRWEGLPDDVRETITVHFTAKRGDWCDIWGNEDVSVWWNRLCDNVLPEKTMPFDLLTVLPTRLDIEVNGFNGGVLNGVPSAYHWYTERYGVKWPCGYDLNISSHLVFTKNYTSKAAYVGYRHECAYILAKGRPALPQKPLPDVLGWKYSGNRHHPTEKPVTSLQPLIESFTHPNAIVLDPFAGSGSTCVAALQSGRRYIGIELLEQYHRAGQQRLTAVQRAMQQGAANDNWFEPEAA